MVGRLPIVSRARRLTGHAGLRPRCVGCRVQRHRGRGLGDRCGAARRRRQLDRLARRDARVLPGAARCRPVRATAAHRAAVPTTHDDPPRPVVRVRSPVPVGSRSGDRGERGELWDWGRPFAARKAAEGRLQRGPVRRLDGGCRLGHDGARRGADEPGECHVERHRVGASRHGWRTSSVNDTLVALAADPEGPTFAQDFMRTCAGTWSRTCSPTRWRSSWWCWRWSGPFYPMLLVLPLLLFSRTYDLSRSAEPRGPARLARPAWRTDGCSSPGWPRRPTSAVRGRVDLDMDGFKAVNDSYRSPRPVTPCCERRQSGSHPASRGTTSSPGTAGTSSPSC